MTIFNDPCPACHGTAFVTIDPVGSRGASGFPCTICKQTGKGSEYRETQARLKKIDEGIDLEPYEDR